MDATNGNARILNLAFLLPRQNAPPFFNGECSSLKTLTWKRLNAANRNAPRDNRKGASFQRHGIALMLKVSRPMLALFTEEKEFDCPFPDEKLSIESVMLKSDYECS
ncbi:hypothetical protein PIB30_004791 [Stylosanthes scabra]|uniref:Uncharacterized protein n=1 Tax=Stylosanthes scabra TaxID=79078 RepID=A0ABU6T5R4_9FABA|nr:hypothetical protein [Stylosanthes scabra]